MVLSIFYLYTYPYPKGNKIIIVIFAGRRKYLDILLRYLNYLKNQNKISEIHFWQFTSNKTSEEYLNSLANLHKTNGLNSYYRNIYPLIHNNNYFIIKINFEDNGAYLLINDKFEIIFNLHENNDIIISLNISNHIYYGTQTNIYKKNIYITYLIKIIDYHINIADEKNLLIDAIIDDNSFNSIKIKSQANAETIWDYEENINKDMKLYDTKFRRRPYWYEAYKFYLNYSFDVLIKLDDDICFIDVRRFDEFINYIKSQKKSVILPNLVNHAVSFYYNVKFKLIPNSIISNIYKGKKHSLEIFDYFKDGDEAKKIHRFFLDNVDKFTKNNFRPIKLTGQKTSICMFGVVKKYYDFIYNQNVIWNHNNYPGNYDFDDEVYTYSLKNNYLFTRFVCMHYAFEPQRENGLSEDLLENYNYLSKNYMSDL